MELIKAANLALRFALELCALAALGYWGFKTGNVWFMKILLGLGSPIAAAIVWGLFVSPKASYDIGDPARLAIEIAVFGLAAMALYHSGQTNLCVIFVFTAVICRAFISIFNQ